MNEYYDLENLTPAQARQLIVGLSRLSIQIPQSVRDLAEAKIDLTKQTAKLHPLVRMTAIDLANYGWQAIIPVDNEANRENAVDAILASYDKDIIFLHHSPVMAYAKKHHITSNFDDNPRVTVIKSMRDYFSVTRERRDDLIVYEYPGPYSKIPHMIGREFEKRVCLASGMTFGEDAQKAVNHDFLTSPSTPALKTVIKDFYPDLEVNAPFLNSRKKSIEMYKVIPYLNKHLRAS